MNCLQSFIVYTKVCNIDFREADKNYTKKLKANIKLFVTTADYNEGVSLVSKLNLNQLY